MERNNKDLRHIMIAVVFIELPYKKELLAAYEGYWGGKRAAQEAGEGGILIGLESRRLSNGKSGVLG